MDKRNENEAILSVIHTDTKIKARKGPIEKIWITRDHFDLGPNEHEVNVWANQKPVWNNDKNGQFWWCDCHGKLYTISTKLCKVLFGVVPIKNEIYTIKIEDDETDINKKSYIVVQRQTPKDCPMTNTEIIGSMDW